jgi:hypothetical protein
MLFKSRKFLLWLVSVMSVLGMYLVVTSLSERPEIEFDRAEDFSDEEDKFKGEIGRIGETGVVGMQNPIFVHRNKDGEVDRVLGFEELLHEEGDLWDIKKPYMNIFRRSFKCYLTADMGNVLLEPDTRQPSPKEATLMDNVVVHILPEPGSDMKESKIYLDDIFFVSERSLFSTEGPIRFVSERAEMLGRGMELIYNREADEIEFLRIIHLERLNLKQSSKTSLFGETPSEQKEVSSDKESWSTEAAISQKAGNYRCIFRKNVVIDTAEEIIFADEIIINDIFFDKAYDNGSTESDDGDANSVEMVNAAVPTSGEPNESSENYKDVIVTCDGGIIVFGMDYFERYGNLPELASEMAANDIRSTKKLYDVMKRPSLVAKRIDCSALSGNTVASGASEITFYTNDIVDGEAKEAAVPVTITADKKMEFLPASNQVVFEGNCLCAMDREDANSQQRYTLSAPKLTVDLSKDDNEVADIEHLTADGGTVRLATIKKAGEKLLGGVELKCSRFDYEAGEPVFTAFGPGVIKVDNSNISVANSEVGRFSLKKPCWAMIEDFDTLKFYLESNRINRIVANAEKQKIYVGYVPVVNGQLGQAVKVTASSIEAVLYESADEKTELSTLRATGGVVYEDEDKEFTGSEFFFDAEKLMITVVGSEGEACYFNGNAAKRIDYDLKNDKVNVENIGPGVLQIKR